MEAATQQKFQVLKIENAESAPEIIIYFWIESLGDFIHTMQRAHRLHGAGDAVLVDAGKAHADQTLLVEIMKSRDGFGFADHAEYMRWYRWWNNWHKNDLSDEQWSEVNSRLKWDGTQTEESFAKLRPSGSWRE